MLIGKFIKETETTRETVRYYIDEALLTPEKINGKYNFTKQDKEDFKNIRELREMGLSIKVIKQIKKNHEQCGTVNQWQSNLEIVDKELNHVLVALEKLSQQKQVLSEMKEELEKLIDRSICHNKKVE